MVSNAAGGCICYDMFMINVLKDISVQLGWLRFNLSCATVMYS